jgi:hypothetical protein
MTEAALDTDATCSSASSMSTGKLHERVCAPFSPAGPTESTTLKDVLAATVRGAGKAPHQSYQRALLHQGKRSWPGTPILIPRGGHMPCGSYQLNAGNRCADCAFRRSRPTVGAEVMRSIGGQVCVLPMRLRAIVLLIIVPCLAMPRVPAGLRAARQGYR